MWRTPCRLACCAAVAWLVLLPRVALAHETRDVASGKYAIVVGFLNEPAYVGQPNGLDLKVTKYGGKPPGGLDQSLKVEVITGSNAPMTLTLTAVGDGAWAGYFIPTATGDYSFHISGTIEGNAVDETFTSSPNGFASVESTTAFEYPVKLAAVEDLTPRIDTAKDDASSARTLGIVGIAVGAVGVLIALAAIGLSRRRREPPPPASPSPEPAPSGRLVR
jgi:hypothetical protein